MQIAIEFLASGFFLKFCVPLLTVAMTIFLRYVTRNDKHVSFKKEDLAVGMDLSITALVIFITHCTALAKQAKSDQEMASNLAIVPWFIMAFVIGIWAVSTVVRKRGWERAGKLNVFWGIVLPDLFGLAALLFVVNWIAQFSRLRIHVRTVDNIRCMRTACSASFESTDHSGGSVIVDVLTLRRCRCATSQ